MIDLYEARPWRANFLAAVGFSKNECVRLIPAENIRTQLCLQVELAEEKSKSLHSQKSLPWAQRMQVTKEKHRYSEFCKKVVCRSEISPKHSVKLKPEAGPRPARNQARPEKPGPTYNSGCQTVLRKSRRSAKKSVNLYYTLYFSTHTWAFHKLFSSVLDCNHVIIKLFLVIIEILVIMKRDYETLAKFSSNQLSSVCKACCSLFVVFTGFFFEHRLRHISVKTFNRVTTRLHGGKMHSSFKHIS